MRTRARIRIAGLVLGAALVGGVAWAATADTAAVYTACKLDALGTIRLINPSLGQGSLLGHCSKLETQITWNQAGAPGATGPAGPKGPAGTAGAAGPKGDTGATGSAGAAGAAGAKGEQGEPGSNGTNGVNGEPGPKGDPCLPDTKGCQGPKGDAGAPGAIGPEGPPGSATPATRTATTLERQPRLVTLNFVPVSTSADFGTLLGTCEATGTQSNGILANLYIVDSTAGAGRLILVDGANLDRVLTAGVRVRLAQAQFNTATAQDPAFGYSFTVVRFTTAADGSPYMSSERILLAFEALPDGSCRISTTITNDQ